MENDLRIFFEDKNLVCAIDFMAQRYSLTPFEILTDMTINEFNFNIAVMTVGYLKEMQDAKDKLPQTPTGTPDWQKWGIARTVVKKGQE